MGKTVALTIEPMLSEDLGQVLAIEQASFTMPWSRNLFLAELRNQRIATLLVAVADGAPSRTVLGYIIAWNVEDELHILDLATAPAWRMRGIAKGLVLELLIRAFGRGARRAFLEVRASNKAAKRLYAGLGFTESFVREEYYDQPIEDAVIMTLETAAYGELLSGQGGRS